MGAARIGVVSDTHGNLPLTALAVETLQSQNVAVVLHCGDIGNPAVIGLFNQWPSHFVSGNVDSDPVRLQAAAEQAGQTFHGRMAEIEVAGRKIAVLHGDDAAALRETIGSGEYDLVCSGHTHRASLSQEGKTLILNPGAVFRANPHTVAVVDLETMTVEHLPLTPASAG